MKKKILFTILTIILVIVILYIIFFFRNNSILTSVLNIENEYKNKSNISVEAKVYNENNSSEIFTMTLSHKDNLYKSEYNYNNNDILVFLYNNNIKQTQCYNLKTGNTEIVENNSFTAQSPMYTLLSDYDRSELTRLALTKWISTETIDNVNCYKIETENRIIWVDKETKLPKKIKFLQSSNDDSIIVFSNWNIDNLTDNDMKLP